MKTLTFILLVITFLSCKKVEIPNIDNKKFADFKEFFVLMQKDSVINIFSKINGIGPRRNGDEILLELNDSSRIFFSKVSGDIITIEKKNISVGDNELTKEANQIIQLYRSLDISAATYSSTLKILMISFILKNFDEKSLPQYEYPNNIYKKLETEIDTGYLIHSPDKSYENSAEYIDLQPLRLASGWYYYTI